MRELFFTCQQLLPAYQLQKHLISCNLWTNKFVIFLRWRLFLEKWEEPTQLQTLLLLAWPKSLLFLSPKINGEKGLHGMVSLKRWMRNCNFRDWSMCGGCRFKQEQ